MDYKQEYEELSNKLIAILMTLQPSMMKKSVTKLETAIAYDGKVPWLEHKQWQGNEDTLYAAKKTVKSALKVRERQLKEWREGLDTEMQF